MTTSMVQLNFFAAKGSKMPKLNVGFPTQSETDSLMAQMPDELLPEFVRSLPMESKEEAELAVYRERPSEAGRRRLAAMGIKV